MQFISTRGEEKVTGAEAIVKGIAADGGLFVPASFPAVSQEELESMLGMDYPERAAFILHKYLDEYDKDELLAACFDAEGYACYKMKRMGLSAAEHGFVSWNGTELNFEYSQPDTGQTMQM